MSQQENFDIPIQKLELMARACERRHTLKRKSKLIHFDSVTHELEKYNEKMNKNLAEAGKEQEKGSEDREKKKIQELA